MFPLIAQTTSKYSRLNETEIWDLSKKPWANFAQLAQTSPQLGHSSFMTMGFHFGGLTKGCT
jgi:hypothetical protein